MYFISQIISVFSLFRLPEIYLLFIAHRRYIHTNLQTTLL